MLTRRGLILAAPAVVLTPGLLMPVRAWKRELIRIPMFHCIIGERDGETAILQSEMRYIEVLHG